MSEPQSDDIVTRFLTALRKITPELGYLAVTDSNRTEEDLSERASVGIDGWAYREDFERMLREFVVAERPPLPDFEHVIARLNTVIDRADIYSILSDRGVGPKDKADAEVEVEEAEDVQSVIVTIRRDGMLPTRMSVPIPAPTSVSTLRVGNTAHRQEVIDSLARGIPDLPSGVGGGVHVHLDDLTRALGRAYDLGRTA